MSFRMQRDIRTATEKGVFVGKCSDGSLGEDQLSAREAVSYNKVKRRTCLTVNKVRVGLVPLWAYRMMGVMIDDEMMNMLVLLTFALGA